MGGRASPNSRVALEAAVKVLELELQERLDPEARRHVVDGGGQLQAGQLLLDGLERRLDGGRVCGVGRDADCLASAAVDLCHEVLEALLPPGEQDHRVGLRETFCDLLFPVSDKVLAGLGRSNNYGSLTAPPVPAPTPATTAKKDFEGDAMTLEQGWMLLAPYENGRSRVFLESVCRSTYVIQVRTDWSWRFSKRRGGSCWIYRVVQVLNARGH